MAEVSIPSKDHLMCRLLWLQVLQDTSSWKLHIDWYECTYGDKPSWNCRRILHARSLLRLRGRPRGRAGDPSLGQAALRQPEIRPVSGRQGFNLNGLTSMYRHVQTPVSERRTKRSKNRSVIKETRDSDVNNAPPKGASCSHCQLIARSRSNREVGPTASLHVKQALRR